MRQTISSHRKIIALHLMLSAFSSALLFAAVSYSGSKIFTFLVWNLFLAWIPLLVSLWIESNQDKHLGVLLLAGAAWLLFFPNAPYIVTDLVHFEPRGKTTALFLLQLFTLLSFAFAGLMIGMFSLRIIHRILLRTLSATKSWAVVCCVLFLASFGIYLGRFQRWNSWDVLTDPLALFSDIFRRILSPLDHPRTFVVTLLLFALLLVVYILFCKTGKKISRDPS